MLLEIKKYLHDVAQSIDSIEQYLKGKRDFNEYQANKLLRRGIERELEIIGEAVSRILKIDSNINISESRRIVDLRNWIIHGYDRVDNVIIWGIINKDINRLKQQVDELMKE
jgi:uncharacterized protein with HEPN domain